MAIEQGLPYFWVLDEGDRLTLSWFGKKPSRLPQAFWLKLSTPWFVNEAKNFILTPAVSFNWLGKGGMKANEKSEAKAYGSDYVPFRNFAVVGDLTATYKF